MKIEKNVLNSVLRVLGKVVCQTSPVEVLRSVRFVGMPGNVRAMATDGMEVVSLAIEAECEGEIDYCIEYRKLREMLRTVKGELELDGNKVEYPQVAIAPEDAISIALPKDFCSLLALAAPIVDRQEARPSLQGINLSRDGLTVTNGKELLNLPCPLDLRDEFTLPFPLAFLTAKLEESGMLQVWHEKEIRYFRMEIGNFLWIGKAQPGNFPNWRQVLPAPQSLDYSVTIHEVDRVIDFLKVVPDHPPFHGIELNVTTSGVAVIPVDYPNMTLDVSADHLGANPRAVLALNKHILMRMLQQGYKTFRANADGCIPVVAEGGYGKYIAMPIHIMPKEIQPNPQMEKKKMESENKAVESVEQSNHEGMSIAKQTEYRSAGVPPKVPEAFGNAESPEVRDRREATLGGNNPMDELNANVEEFRNKLKTLFDESNGLIRKVKEAAFAQKQKEREFVQARRAIERIKMAI